MKNQIATASAAACFVSAPRKKSHFGAPKSAEKMEVVPQVSQQLQLAANDHFLCYLNSTIVFMPAPCYTH